MSERDEQRSFVATQLAALIVGATQSKPAKIEINNALCVLDNIAQYAIDLAQDRAAAAISTAAAERLCAAIVKKHIQTYPTKEPG